MTVYVKTPAFESKKINTTVGSPLNVKFKGTALTPTYTSNKPTVATVDSEGNVKVLSKGNAKIIVEVNGKKYKCNIKVK